jgi:G6PDH family F420-dependent oxidoreductase
MAEFGFTLYSEGFAPRELVKQAVMAEEAGFDFLAISDHFHPWLPEQSHTPFAWSVLGAISQATSNIKLVTMVTCPTFRYHPAVVAQMAATVGVLSGGRFTLGVGSGERLNEHVVGKGWYSPKIRQAMLREAVEIIRGLWQGEYFSYDGVYFSVEDARIFDLPTEPMDIFCAAGGPKAAVLAAEVADGLCMSEPSANLVEVYEAAGGDTEAIWSQATVAWAPTKKQALEEAYKQFRFSIGGWPVQAELPNPANFAAASRNVKPEDLSKSIPAGPDAAMHAQGLQTYFDQGVTRLAVSYPGNDFEAFMDFWANNLRPLVDN